MAAAAIKELDKEALKQLREKAEQASRKAYQEALADEIEPRNKRIADLTTENERLRQTLEANVGEIEQLQEQLAEIEPELKQTKTRTKAKAKGKGTDGKRERRSKEQLEKDAAAIIQMVKAAGKSGVSTDQIRGRFKKVGASITTFVKKHGKIELKNEGSKKEPIYKIA